METTEAAEPAILLRGATKTYGVGEVAVQALRAVDLEIRAEEFVVLLGPSGSGKTTLLNLIGGIEPATLGRDRRRRARRHARSTTRAAPASAARRSASSSSSST